MVNKDRLASCSIADAVVAKSICQFRLRGERWKREKKERMEEEEEEEKGNFNHLSST